MRGKATTETQKGQQRIPQKFNPDTLAPNTSFFDLSEPQQKPEWWKYTPVNIKSSNEEQVYLQINLYKRKKGSDIFKAMECVILDNLFAVVIEQQIVKKHLDLQNIFLERIQIQLNNQFIFGIRLSRGCKTLDLFAQDILQRDKCYNVIKRWAIQKNFHENYALNQLIGQGNFSKVYLAMNTLNGQNQAVKVFEKKMFFNQNLERQALSKEIKILRLMDHPGITKLQEVYENSGHIFLVIDYHDGGELLKFLQQFGPPQEQHITLILQNLLQSLNYIHKKQILHRDIKPENIVLKNRFNFSDVCLTDFGLADFYNPQGNYLFKRCGTPGYVAPEILRDNSYDQKVDIFSIGVITFMMLTGKTPFSAAQSERKLVKENCKCKINFAPLQNLSSHAKKLTISMLEENPNKRPTAEEALKSPWFQQYKNNSLSLPIVDSSTNKGSSLKNDNNLSFNMMAQFQLQQQIIQQQTQQVMMIQAQNYINQLNSSININSLQQLEKVEVPKQIIVIEDDDVIEEEIPQIQKTNYYTTHQNKKCKNYL